MHDLDRIEQALRDQELDDKLFERCAQDLLIELYPGLSPIPGGADHGRDADIHGSSGTVPPRLMVTCSRELKNIKANMLEGLKSLSGHGVPYNRIILANPGLLNETQREKLHEAAKAYGACVEAIYDRGFFASRLRRDGEWRQKLLGLSAEPITLSRMPWRLAESPWARLPLLGRQKELENLSEKRCDLIITGPPGVGKSRLVASLDDVAFVDLDADTERLADDIRWQCSARLVIDNGGQAQELIRYIHRLRRQEKDWLSIQLIVVCWPDEVDEVHELMPGAEVIELDLLERPHIDAIIKEMGITQIIARQEILDQAEGRPGWAVSLGEMLLRSGWEKLVNGQALLGEVDSYLRRAQLNKVTRDILALIAALQGVSDRDLKRLADSNRMSHPELVRLLHVTAKGGLLDVSICFGIKLYQVRPTMLADALSTEHFFVGEPPLGDYAEIIKNWSDKSLNLITTVCTAARLGSYEARGIADELIEKMLSDDGIDGVSKLGILKEYLLIDERASNRVLELQRAVIEKYSKEANLELRSLEPIVEMGYITAARYRMAEGIELMLNIALLDKRETSQHPGHPLRKIADLVSSFHPDFPRSANQRLLVADVLDKWLPKGPTDNHWRIFGAVAEVLLSPRLHGSWTAPEDVHRWHIAETVASPTEADKIIDEVWPNILSKLREAPKSIFSSIINVIHEWLRIGSGFDRPFGQDHPMESIQKMEKIGKQLLYAVAPLVESIPGLVVMIQSLASRFNIIIDLKLPEEEAVFFRIIDRDEDWEKSVRKQIEDISELAGTWASNEPQKVICRLGELRKQLDIANLNWPNRIEVACRAIAEKVDNPKSWIEGALEHGLFPEARPFLRKAIVKKVNHLDELLKRCIKNPASRYPSLSEILASPPSSESLQLAISNLLPEDSQWIDLMALRGELSLDVQKTLLEKSKGAVRGSIAVAFFGRTDKEDEAIPEDIYDEWLSAVEDVDPKTLPHMTQHNFKRLIKFLAVKHPDVLESYVCRRLEACKKGSQLDALGYDGWQLIHVLPKKNKTALLKRYTDTTTRWILLEHLVGQDVEWLVEIIDSNIIKAEEALNVRSFHARISVDELAKIVMPRGISPERVASLALTGSWSGEESSMYDQLVNQFKEYAKSNDPSVVALGKAGIKMYTERRNKAKAKEHQRRIRGEI